MTSSKNTDLTERFPEVLKEVRLQKGISQEELADRAGLHPTYISQIERSLKSPSLRSLGLIADALEIPLSSLIRKMEK